MVSFTSYISMIFAALADTGKPALYYPVSPSPVQSFQDAAPGLDSLHCGIMTVIFSDLDGTLLHVQRYSPEAAQPALVALKRRSIPLVLCTSKTRAEVEFWRKRLEIRDPFIVENGGALYIPDGYFPFAPEGAVRREGYQVIELGAPYAELVEALEAAARESGCRVVSFHGMTVEEISARTLLPPEQAQLAKQREYDEPFEIVGTGTHNLLTAIERRGKRWTRGNRFYHITGETDKATAVKRLSTLYERAFPGVVTAGIGDSHNDAAFLDSVQVPVIVKSRFAPALKLAVPRSRVTRAPGPHGWNEAVLDLVA
jgi:mannosyl-3-phosphoglycerate phosphatase